MVVDRDDCGLVVLICLNCGHHGGRVPRPDVGAEPQTAAGLLSAWGNGGTDPMAAVQGAGWLTGTCRNCDGEVREGDIT